VRSIALIINRTKWSVEEEPNEEEEWGEEEGWEEEEW